MGRRPRAARWLTALVLLLSAAHAQQPPPAEEEPVLQLDDFVVTGTRIRQTDLETSIPLLRIEREEIQRSGAASVGELLRQLPQNNSGSVNENFGNGFAAGATTVSLRGLGANNTLFLVNGRRIAPYGRAGGSGFFTVFDVNSIPLAAIERIEVLKDGASALYGSDAVAGVINFILREDVSDAEATVAYGNTTGGDDMGLITGNVIKGFSAGGFRGFVLFHSQARNAVYMRDRALSASADQRPHGGLDGRSPTGFPASVVVPWLVPPSGSFAGVPLPGVPRRISGVTSTVPAPGSTDPQVEDFVRGNQPYDFNRDTTLVPAYRRGGFFARASRPVGLHASLFSELSWQYSSLNFEQAPPPVQSSTEGNPPPLVISANNPYNPFGVNLRSFNFRPLDGPPRRLELESDALRLLAGLEGRFGHTGTWESGLLYSRGETRSVSRNALTDETLQQLLAETDRDRALNPFGPSAPGVIERALVHPVRDSTTSLLLWDAHVSGRWLPLPAGTAGIAAGVEQRRETFSDRNDPLLASGAVVAQGGSGGFSASRSVSSLFVEISVPLLRTLEAQLAGRVERYNDFGTAWKPKVGFKWKPISAALLRGSFSRSFRAPDLAYLYTTENISFVEGAPDIKRFVRTGDPTDLTRQVRYRTTGDPTLQPEEADSYYVGVLIEPPVVEGLVFSVDAFRFETRNQIESLGINFILANEDRGLGHRVERAAPSTAPDGRIIPGQIIAVNDGFINVGRRQVEGIDFEVRYRLETARRGRFTFHGVVTRQHQHSIQLRPDQPFVDATGTFTFPRTRANGGVHWEKDVWRTSLIAHHTSSTFDTGLFGRGATFERRLGSFTTFDLQASYRGWPGAEITLGVVNVFDRAPPRLLGRTEGYDMFTFDPTGRFLYLRLKQKF